MRFILFIILICSFSIFAADVQVITDKAKGQGFLYEHNSKCYVVTPSHVIEDAKKITALTANRKSYNAKLVKNFDIDLALLELENAKRVCKRATFNQDTKLSSLLKIYEDAVLKSKLSDGSTLQVKVIIVGVDDAEYLQIKPKKTEDILKQGYSGSVLFIANQPSGILLEVDDGSGFVYRSDALNKRLNDYFQPNHKTQVNEKVTPTINDNFRSSLSVGQQIDFKIQGEANSPIKFSQVPSDEQVKFNFEILNQKGKKLYKKSFWSHRDEKVAFTPKTSGVHTIRVTGTERYGSFGFNIEQLALNVELRGEGNVVEAGDTISNYLAKGTVAEYKLQVQKNGSIYFRQIPSDEQVKFNFEILNRKGKKIYKESLWSHRDKEITFTPKAKQLGVHTIRITGTERHGFFNFDVKKG